MVLVIKKDPQLNETRDTRQMEKTIMTPSAFSTLTMTRVIVTDRLRGGPLVGRREDSQVAPPVGRREVSQAAAPGNLQEPTAAVASVARVVAHSTELSVGTRRP